MPAMLQRTCQLLGLALRAPVTVRCIQRTITVTSEPSGALVYLNDEEVGRTPVTVPFTFYGTYDVRLEKDGYQTLSDARKADAPVYDWPGIDLFFELLPVTTEAKQQWHFALKQSEPVEDELLIDRAKQMRSLMIRGN